MSTTERTSRELDAALAERLDPDISAANSHLLSGKVSAMVEDYSTSGDVMLLVLEAMRERGYWWTLSDFQSGSKARFRKHSYGRRTILGEATTDTLPRAVALAALAALEKETRS